ncbi:MAG: transcriptional regulator [Deltaproteobacteria bacterium]|jgi:putative transcriptional regulator|nr:transcriptional regulator [Deltaproteobacteria bacterium]
MSKAGAKVLAGAREALQYAKGARSGFRVHVPEEVDVKAIREGLGLSQSQFAKQFGFELAALKNWEQKRRRPEGPARVLLK